MRFASIRSMDTSNGMGIGVSLFVQGCHFHCEGCFNKSTWDFNGGKEFTKEVEDHLIDLANKPYITRITILGGEPLADENIDDMYNLVHRIKETYHNKKLWIYTGYTFEEIMESKNSKRFSIISKSDILVDGRFVYELKDPNLPWRGSSNQRVIDMRATSNNLFNIKLFCN